MENLSEYKMENLSEFEAGRLTGIYHTIATLELAVEDMAPDGKNPTAIVIRQILKELVERVKSEAL